MMDIEDRPIPPVGGRGYISAFIFFFDQNFTPFAVIYSKVQDISDP